MMKHLLFNLLIFIVFINSAQAARVALVIGNGDYPESVKRNLFSPLRNPVNDAIDMKSALGNYDFEVITAKNANQAEMDLAVAQFIGRLRKGDTALFYYSGHGVQVDNVNYLIPVGRQFADAQDVKYYAVKANWILEKMQATESTVNIMILDSCRQQMPTESKGFSSKGFGQMGAKGAIISYATALGESAFGDKSRRNSIYTEHLLKAMENGENLPIEQVFKQARAGVAADTNDGQIPWTGNGLIGDFCFGQCNENNISENDTESTNKWFVIAGTFRIRESAQKHILDLKTKGIDSYIIYTSKYSNLEPNYYIVVVGTFNSLSDAKILAEKIIREKSMNVYVKSAYR